MAKLPSAMDMGARPEAQPSRGVVGYSVPDGGAEAAGMATMQLGAAESQFGDLVQKYSDHLEDKQNKIRAEDATNKLGQAMIDLSVGPDGFVNKKGEAAATQPVFKDYVAKLDAVGKQLAAGLGNDAQREAFKQRFDHSRLDFQQKVLTHVTAENTKYQDKVDTDTVDTEVRKAGIDPMNPMAAETALVRIEAAIKSRAQRNGWPTVTVEDEISKARDKVWVSRLEAMRPSDPALALATLQAIPADKMSPNVRAKLTESLFNDAKPVLAQQLNAMGGAVSAAADATPVPPAQADATKKPALQSWRDLERGQYVGGTAAPADAPRGIRNNNPGNLRRGTKPWQGEVAGSDPSYSSFESPEAGIRAMGKTLLAYNDRGVNTVQDIITTWAPPSENNTTAYVKTVAAALGVKPDEPINVRDAKTLTNLATAIMKVEVTDKGAQSISPQAIQTGLQAALSGKEVPTATKAAKPLDVTDLRIDPKTLDTSKWDARPDGSKKGMGFLGPLRGANGDVMTEYSVGVNIGGKEMNVPTLVPTLTRAEVEQVLQGKVSDAVVRKASDFAAARIQAGKDVFAGPQDTAAVVASPVAPKQPVNVLDVALRDPSQPTGNPTIDKLPPDQKIAVLTEARKLANEGMKGLREVLKDRMNDSATEYMINGRATNPPSREELVGAYGQYEGMQKWRQLQDVANTGQRILGLKTMPDAQIESLLATSKPQPGDGFADRERTYGMLVNAANQVRQSRAADPVQYALSTGAYGIKPIADLKDPNALTAEIAARTAAAPRIAADYGTAPTLLTKQESAGIAATLKAAPVDQQKQYLGSIFTGVKDMQVYRKLMAGFAPDAPVIATAGIDQALGHRMSDNRDVADLVLRGNALLNPPKREDGGNHEGGKSLIRMPKDEALRAGFDSEVKDAYAGNAQARDLVYQRTQAIYAALSAEAGDYSGEPANKRMKAAVALATGGVERYNGAHVVMPYGMPLDTFKDGVRDRMALLAPNAVGVTPAELTNLPLENSGDGRYYVKRGSGYIVNKDGGPLVVDFNYALPPAPPAEAAPIPPAKPRRGVIPKPTSIR